MHSTTFTRTVPLSLASDVLVHASQRLMRWCISRPAPTRASEAAVVRQMARQLQFSDPGLASDLFAAADRHEHDNESLR